MRKLRKQPKIYTLKPEWIHYVVLTYGLSAEWLITGEGGYVQTARKTPRKLIEIYAKFPC